MTWPRREHGELQHGNSSTGNSIPHVIDGQQTEWVSGARFARGPVDPWTREPYAEVALGGEQDADRAVQAARRALDEGRRWPRMGYAERGALLHRFADHARLAIAEVLPMDTGHHAYTRFEPVGVVAPQNTFSRELFTEPKAVVMQI